MKKKLMIGFSVYVLFIVLLTNHSLVKAKELTSTDHHIRSTFVMDVKSIQVGINTYSAMLDNDYLYILDGNGDVVKTISYLSDPELIDQYSASGTGFDKTNVHLEIIYDVDGLGTPDFLIVMENLIIDQVPSVEVISYETGQILWSVQPSMKSDLVCGLNKGCTEPVSISDYQVIDSSLYIASGYELNQFDLETGDITNSYVYEDNIWSFDQVNDINQDGVKDFAVAVQPSYVKFIDGATFKVIKELKITSDYALYSGNRIILLNVWSVKYIPSRNILVTASEDGYITEIDMYHITIEKHIQIHTFNSLTYSNLIDSKQTQYFQSYTSGKVTYYYFGNYMKAANFMDIIPVNDFDDDGVVDYLVEYIPFWTKNLIVVANGSQVGLLSGENTYIYKFLFTDGTVMGILDGSKNYRIMDIKTKQTLLTSNDRMFNPGDDVAAKLDDFDIHPVDDGYIIKFNDSEIIKIPKTGTQDGFDWLLFIPDNQVFEADGDYNLVYDTLSTSKVGFTILDANLNELGYYYTKNRYITDTQIENDTLIIFEKSYDFTQFDYKIFRLSDGQLIGQANLNTILDADGITDYTLVNSGEFYGDVNQDGYNEILVTVETATENLVLIIDIKNQTILNSLNILETTDLSSVTLYPDINGDGLQELVTYSYNLESSQTDFNLYLSQSGLLFDTSRVETTHYDFKVNGHSLVSITDINNDSYPELVFDASNNENIAYFVDLHLQSLYSFTNSYNSHFKFVLSNLKADLDQDGLTDMIVLEATNNEENVANNPIYFTIYHLVDGVFEVSFRQLFTIEYGIQNGMSYDNYYILRDINQDGVKEIIFDQFDKSDTSTFLIFDYQTMTREMVSYNFELKKQVGLSENKGNIKPVYLVSYKGQEYYMLNPKGTYSTFNALFNADTYALWNLMGTNFEGFYQDLALFHDSYSHEVKTSTIFNQTDIKSSIMGFFHNVYHIQINSQDVKSIKVYYGSLLYKESTQNNVKVNLPQNAYQLIFQIDTKDGGTFYYYDNFIITDNVTQTIELSALLLVALTGIFFGSRFAITKFFFRK